MWCWKVRNVLWRIPADTRAEAEAFLCYLLAVKCLPAEVRFVGHQPL